MTKTFESIVKLLAEGDESLFVSKRKPTNMATSSPTHCSDFARAVTPTPDSPSQLSLQALVFELGDDHTPKDRVKDITSQVINMLHQDGLARKQLGSLGNELGTQ